MGKIKQKLPIFIVFFATTLAIIPLVHFFNTVHMPPLENVKKFSIIKDVKSVNIDGFGLFNSGVIALEDGYLFVTRRTGKSFWKNLIEKIVKINKSELLIGELDKNFSSKDITRTVFSPKDRNWLYMDARLIRVGSDIYMIYCKQYKYGKKRAEASLYLSKLEKVNQRWQVVTNVKLEYKDSPLFYQKGLVTKNFEKNWMPFSLDKKLYFVYLMEPDHLILDADLNSGICTKLASTKNNFLKDVAPLRGSTPAVFDEQLGEFITLYHFVLYSNCGWGFKKKYGVYYIGGYTFSKKSPFLMSSKMDGILTGKGFYKKKKIIFPMALIRDGQDYLMFYGEDDRVNKVARINREKLIATMKKPKDIF
jgi:predicted GH43/DUF377 family glycosyl hydrolase